MASEAPRILFFHNPKAGGTAVASQFKSMIGVENSMIWDQSCPPDRGSWKSCSRHDLIHGHCGYDFFQEVGPNYLLTTNFRHPVSRIVSLYDFWRNNTDGADLINQQTSLANSPVTVIAPYLARHLSFPKFLREQHVAISIYTKNFHARQLLKTPWEYWKPNRFNLLTLKRRIRRMHWFYVCEYPMLSEAWFRIQFPTVPLPLGLSHENTTNYEQKEKTIPSTDDVALVLSNNWLDLAIYRFAVRLLEKRLANERV